MSEFILGAVSMFTVMAFIVVYRDYRRWCRERDAYRATVVRRARAAELKIDGWVR